MPQTCDNHIPPLLLRWLWAVFMWFGACQRLNFCFDFAPGLVWEKADSLLQLINSQPAIRTLCNNAPQQESKGKSCGSLGRRIVTALAVDVNIFYLYYIPHCYSCVSLLGKEKINLNRQIIKTCFLQLIFFYSSISSSTKVRVVVQALCKLFLSVPHHCCLVLNMYCFLTTKGV